MKTGPKYKICKRLGSHVFEKCQTQQFMLSEARRGKARSGRGRRKTLSDFGRQLLEKQKVRYTYGISEKQLSRYVEAATRKKGVDPVSELFTLLESRLDNVVYRIGFPNTRGFARQMVSHGHIVVNGRKVTIPSYFVLKGEKISIREGSKKKTLFTLLSERLADFKPPVWISFNKKSLEGEVIGTPAPEGELPHDLSAVLEFYSR